MSPEFKKDLKKAPRRLFAETVGKPIGITILRSSWEFRFTPGSRPNIDKTNQMVEEDDQRSLIYEHVHTDHSNAPTGVYVCADQIMRRRRRNLLKWVSWLLKRSKRRDWFLPYSFYLTDEWGRDNFPDDTRKARMGLFGAATFFDLDTYGVIPRFQVDDDKYPYEERHARIVNKRFMRAVKESRKRGPVIVGIAPEGHRSDDAKTMQQGEPGVVHLAKMLSPCVVSPIGMVCENGTRGANLGKRIDISVGEPFLVTLENVPPLEEFMQRLAAQVPEERRGMWANRVADGATGGLIKIL